MAPARFARCSPAPTTRSAPPPSTSPAPIRTNSSMDAKTILVGGLAVVLAVYAVALIRGGLVVPTVLQTAIGFVTAFLDTLGIGSFATTTAVYKLRAMVPVQLLPGTLNVGHPLPTIAQAFIYTQIVPVESTTLVLMIAAAIAGTGRSGRRVQPRTTQTEHD